MRKICVVTGSRAEYGLLYSLMKEIQGDPDLELQVVVTGSHLSREFGLTYQEIEGDGFTIHWKVDMLLASDTPLGVTKSLGLGVIGFGEAFEFLQPHLVVVLGDRYEILAAAQAALIARLPMAHIAGGDITEGAFDEAIRHSITKMAHLHFVTNGHSWQVVRQLGEDPQHIHLVGSLAIDRIKQLKLLKAPELEKALDIVLLNKNLMITFHPATLSEESSLQQLKELLLALHQLGLEFGLFFTKPNADPLGRRMIQQLEAFVDEHPNARLFDSLGQRYYFSLISLVDAVVGNSSSGLYEVPSFQRPTVNIGDRQRGRLMAASVINCSPDHREIKKAINRALTMDCTATVNPYGGGRTAQEILKIIKKTTDFKLPMKKKFFML